MDQQKVDIGRRIKRRRQDLKIKQNALAERLDISNNHLSAIENGKENPSIEILIKICHSLKVTPDYLLLGAMHSNNVPMNILDSLRLCREEDIELFQIMVETLVARNERAWNEPHYA